MFAEAMVYLRSFAGTPPQFRRHLGEAIGHWGRGRRQTLAWAPHVANTLGLLDTTIDDIASRRTVVVLGSGPLFDVPLESLARTFGQVLLLDQVHLSAIRRRVDRYPNVRLVWRDLAPGLGFLKEVADLDWVISVNLLSQLGSAAPQGEGRLVIERHLADLTALPCPVTLVTDVEYRKFDESGELRHEFDQMHGVRLPRPDLQWKWELAPLGEEGIRDRRVHSVAAWADWNAAARNVT